MSNAGPASGRADLNVRENLLCNSSWERGVRNARPAAVWAPRSVQEEGRRRSRRGAAAPCSPGETHKGAGCSAASRHCTEQISMCSHGGARIAGGGCCLKEAIAHREPWMEPLETMEKIQSGGAADHGETHGGATYSCSVEEGVERAAWQCLSVLWY